MPSDWSHEDEIWRQLEALDSEALEDAITFGGPAL
jgi:hypothetical protein